MRIIDVRIAGKNIRIFHLYQKVEDECTNFLADFTVPDIIVNSSCYEIEGFMKRSSNAHIPNKTGFGSDVVVKYDYDYFENLLVCEKIANQLVDYGILMVHGAAIELNGKSFIFSGPSGVGKTTHILNWKERFPNTRIINGDKPFVDVNSMIVYGSPWCGKEKLGINSSANLSGVIVLKRDITNSIHQIQFSEAMHDYIRQVYIPQDSNTAIKAYRYFNDFRAIPFYLLSCTKDSESAVIAYNGLGMERLM